MAYDPVLTFTERGIYCPAGDFFIDPWKPVDRALITHAHSDHARAGHRTYLATEGTAPVLRHRLGDISLETVRYGARTRIGSTHVSFHPAGHVPGSAQIRVERAGEVWVVSGDYKIEADGLSEPFEPLRCDAFISECTFGLPVFHWRPQTEIAEDMNLWWQHAVNEGKTPILCAYSLGKAQRVLRLLNPEIGPILTHGAVETTTQILREQGYQLPPTTAVTSETDPKAVPNAILIAPPSAAGGNWAKQFRPFSTGFASGWMQLRGIRRRRAMDRGFAVSDHADWRGLNSAIRETGAEKIFVTHGYTEIFSRWLQEQGYDARVVSTDFTGDLADAE